MEKKNFQNALRYAHTKRLHFYKYILYISNVALHSAHITHSDWKNIVLLTFSFEW